MLILPKQISRLRLEMTLIGHALNLIPKACVIPHHDTFGKGWLTYLMTSLPEHATIGIDEETGMLDNGPEGTWNIYGKGAVTLCRDGETRIYRPGETFALHPSVSNRHTASQT